MSATSLQAITERLRDDKELNGKLAAYAPQVLESLKLLEGYCLNQEELNTLMILLSAQWEPRPPRFADAKTTNLQSI